MNKKILALIILIISSTKIYAAEKKSILVSQPVYKPMEFYVYKPSNKKLAKTFYVTYDGYLVYKNRDKIWKYGTYEKNKGVKTDHVVGSVVPSDAGIKPYDKKASSVAPIVETANANNTNNAPEKENPAIKNYPTDWTQNPDFMQISNWKKSIDRVGVINSPFMPVAWKGDHPETVFVWTGMEWRQISVRGSENPLNAVKRDAYNLTKIINGSNIKWRAGDSVILGQYTGYWGYKWLGEIILTGE